MRYLLSITTNGVNIIELCATEERAKERFDFFYAMVDSVKIIDQEQKREYVDYRWVSNANN